MPEAAAAAVQIGSLARPASQTLSRPDKRLKDLKSSNLPAVQGQATTKPLLNCGYFSGGNFTGTVDIVASMFLPQVYRICGGVCVCVSVCA